MASKTRLRLFAALLAAFVLLLIWLLRDIRHKPGSADSESEAAATGRESSSLGSSSSTGQGEVREFFSLKGRVIWQDGRPAEGATVLILSRPDAGRTTFAPDRQTTSDSSGSFSFERQVSGEFIVQAQAQEAYSPAVRVHLSATSKPVTLMLLPAASLTITVVSATDQKPIRAALVRVQLSDDQVMQGDAFAEERTNDAGQAKFSGLNPVSHHPVWAEADGYAGKQVVIKARDSATSTWTEKIPLIPGGGVSGRVLDSHGRGVPGALVGWCATQETLAEENFRVFMPFSDYGRMSEQITDADGRYHLTVEQGAGCVVAEKPGLRIGTKCHVPVDKGKETRGVDVVLLDGVAVRGKVVDPSGQPAPHADVLATTADNVHTPSMHRAYRYRTRSDSQGRFTISGLPPIAMALAATTPTASSPLAEIDPRGGQEVILKLEYDATLDGEVTEHDGKPVAFAAVNYWVEPDFPALEKANGGKPPTVIKEYALPTNNDATVTDENGRFHVGGLAPGRYTVRALRPVANGLPPTYGAASQHQVPTGSNIRLVMPGIGGIRGKVRSEGGGPVRSFKISLLVGSASGSPDYLFATAHPFLSADGSFLFPNVPANGYTMRVEGDAIVSKRLNVEVKGSDTVDVGTIIVAKGEPSRPGLVVDAQRDPIPMVTVTIEVPNPAQRIQLWSESDGTFRVPSVPEGTSVRLRADWAGGGASEWVTLSPSDSSVTLMVHTRDNGTVRGILIDSGELVGRIVILSHTGDKPPGTGETQVRSTTQTQPGGQFTFEQVPPGSYVLWAAVGTDFARHPAPIEVTSGKDVNVVFNVPESPKVPR